LLRYEGGLVCVFDASDYSGVPATIALNGSLGRAVAVGGGVKLEYWGGGSEEWRHPSGTEASMDRAMAEIVAWLDGAAEFPDPAENSLRTLETIIACHASHRRQSAWTALPLSAADREIEVRSG
jgi:hypothetical protein